MVRLLVFPAPEQCISQAGRISEADPVGCRYILVYPQGCDVCNHLSLFLCVADYDKLLPGEHHFFITNVKFPIPSSYPSQMLMLFCCMQDGAISHSSP